MPDSVKRFEPDRGIVAEGPLVSVCIGVYNRERYIRECIDSVLAQTYPNLEIIVVDDASTDRSVDILESYGDKVRLIKRAANSGLPAIPRNDALRVARGEYVAFLDSDDSWAPEKMALQMEQLVTRPELGWSHTYASLMDERSNFMGIRHEGMLRDKMPVFQELINHCFITISSVVVRRSALDAVGHFTEDPRMRGREDIELFLRLAAKHQLGFVPEALTHYRRAASGLSYHDSYWRSTPKDIVGMSMVYRKPQYWQGLVTGNYYRDVFSKACQQCIIFWRDRRRTARSLWFVWQGLRIAPFSGMLWLEGVNTMGRAVMRKRSA